MPPAAATLGFRFVAADPDRGTIEVTFAATEAFTNQVGHVLGAFLAAMLYDTMGPALLATLAPDRFPSTTRLSVDFLHPARPGRFTGRGRVVRRDGDDADLEVTLTDDAGTVVATGTARARVIAAEEAGGAV
jgi:uncharacterized protein (TIGR00369 family)